MSSSSINIILGKSGLKLKQEDISRALRIDPEEEAKEFFVRVKRRAEQEAKKIIEEAYKEAEKIKQQAYLDAKREKENELNKLIDQKRKELKEYGKRLGNILSSLNIEKEKLLQQYKEDLVEFIKIAVEKTLQVVLTDKYTDVFFALLKEAIKILDNQKDVKVFVNKDDVPLVNDLFNSIDIKSLNWEVVGQEDVEKGTIVLKTNKVIIDNSIHQRLSHTKEMVNQLSSL